ANELYSSSLLESGKVTQAAKARFLKERAARYRNVTVSILSGMEINTIAQIYVQHINRCMLARLESYRQAFQESGRVPSVQDFDQILKECRETRRMLTQQAAKNLKEFVVSQGGMGSTPPWVPDENYFDQSSAIEHDEVLQVWKVWKAKPSSAELYK